MGPHLILKPWIMLSSELVPYCGPYCLPWRRAFAGSDRLAKAPGRTTLLGITLLKRPPKTWGARRVSVRSLLGPHKTDSIQGEVAILQHGHVARGLLDALTQSLRGRQD